MRYPAPKIHTAIMYHSSNFDTFLYVFITAVPTMPSRSGND